MKKIFFIILIFFNLTAEASPILCKDWIAPETDAQGVRAACRDRRPTVNERLGLFRENMDPFDTIYTVRREYCWARWVFESGEPCKRWFFGWAPNWGDGYKKTFTINDVMPYNSSAGSKKVFIHKICLKKFLPQDPFLHSQNGPTNNSNRTKICGYVTFSFGSNSCNSPLLNWDNAFIGCVDAPIKPGPQTYNPTLLPGTVPVVDNTIGLDDIVDINNQKVLGYLSLGSKFDQPVIRLTEYTGSGLSGNSILLRYKYPGDTYNGYDAGKPQLPICSQFPGSANTATYCATILDSDPTQVCAYDQSQTQNLIMLGCVPRPTPQQSNIKIVGKYREYYDTKLKQGFPALDVIFARTFQNHATRYLDADGKLSKDVDGVKYIVDASENATQNVAKLPVKIDKLQLSPGTLPIREYYESIDLSKNPKSNPSDRTISRDDDKFYGIRFNSIIPKFNPNSTDMSKVNVITPFTRNTSIEGGCGPFSLTTDTNYPEYIVPAGIRDRTFCCPPTTTKPTLCTIPPLVQCTPPVDLTNDPVAISAICPGVYQRPADFTMPDKICALPSIDWDITSVYDEPCDSIPVKCDAVDTPTARSGYATWKQAEPDTIDTGFCDPDYGFEAQNIVTIVPKSTGTLSSQEQALANAELTNANNNLAAFKSQFENIGINIPAYYLNQLTGTYYTYSITQLQPTRDCSGGASGGKFITNACVFKGQCSAIIKPSEPSGWATWPSNDGFNDFKSPSQTQLVTDDPKEITGLCDVNHPPTSGTPTRMCYFSYTLNTTLDKNQGFSTPATRTYDRWDVGISNPCSPGN